MNKLASIAAVALGLSLLTGCARARSAAARFEASAPPAAASAAGTGEGRYASLQLRVPADKVDGVRGVLSQLGEITSDVEKVQDVTEERADLKARLYNARVQEKRVLEIMSARTGTISQVVEVERELSRVRETIERLEAQERSLEGTVALATVDVSLTTRTTPAWHTPGKSISRAASSGVQGAAAFGVYAAMAAVASAPILIPIGAIVVAIVLAARGRRRRLA